MTAMEFFGCTFLAFGPAIAMFIFTIRPDPLRIILAMASAFFWLISLFFSSLLWFAVVPLRDTLAFGVPFSVIIQEVFRFLFYLLLKRAEKGLQMVAQKETSVGVTVVSNKHLLAYVAGFGYGGMAGAFSLINILADMTGPGTIGIYGHRGTFFIVSSVLTLAFISLHIVWSVLFYFGLNTKRYYIPIIVVCLHMLVSCMTLFNDRSDPLYAVPITTAYVTLLVSSSAAFVVAGGSFASFRAFLKCC